MAATSNYSDNLKRDITGIVLGIDQSVAKIKELAKGMEPQALQTLSANIAFKLQGKHDTLLQTLEPSDMNKDPIISPLSFVTSVAPLLVKQQQLDSNILSIFSRLRILKDLLDSGEDALKKARLSQCGELLLKGDEIMLSLKKDCGEVFKKLRAVEEMKLQMRRFKEGLDKMMRNQVQQVITFSAKEVEIFDSNTPLIKNHV